MAGEWKELTEILEQQVAATRTSTPDPDLQAPRPHWGEKLSRERNSLESWQKVLELDPQDVDALRAIAENYKSAGAWEELSQALRRLIQVAQLGGAGIDDAELKELYSQLGELEGETLMRTQEAIDAWREVLELDAHDFRALRRSRSCSRRRRAGKSASRSSSGARRRWRRRRSRSTS